VKDVFVTVTATSSLLEVWPSLAVNRSTYVPSPGSATEVEAAEASPNVTVPGPLTCDHVEVVGPSPVTLPLSVVFRFKMAWSGPAFTAGTPL
jgi:hypothetical protein